MTTNDADLGTLICKLAGSKDDCISTLRRLRELGPDAEQAIPSVIDVFRRRDEIISSRALQALTKIGEAAIQPLLKRVSDDDEFVRTYCLGTLAYLDKRYEVPNYLEMLLNATNDPSVHVRRCASVILVQETDQKEAGFPHFIEELSSLDLNTRYLAALTLIAYSVKSAKNDLLAAAQRCEHIQCIVECAKESGRWNNIEE